MNGRWVNWKNDLKNSLIPSAKQREKVGENMVEKLKHRDQIQKFQNLLNEETGKKGVEQTKAGK